MAATPAPAPAWCVSLEAPSDALAAVEAALGQLGGVLVTGVPRCREPVPVKLYLGESPDRVRLTALLISAALAAGIATPEFAVETLANRDWIAENRADLPAIQIGPFYLYGAHVNAPGPADSIPLRIEAGRAFGTGRHESTRGCLLALADLAGKRRIGGALDMGCGTGILALAMAKLWSCPVLAVDNDPEALRIARENARINEVADRVRVRRGRGYDCPALADCGPFELIACNILAQPLCAMAPELARTLAPDGVAVLSGLLADQEAQVMASHADLRLMERIPLAEWVTLVLTR
ncbi:MAG: 50S ribosomal protein L11 methyltransferase [Kiloniellales bacterium]